MKRLIIVANRLPVKVKLGKEEIQLKASAGGLATGLASLNTNYEMHWVGWPGVSPKKQEVKDAITEKLSDDLIHPVFLTEKDIELFYEGFSNKTIWPLFHYFSEYTEFSQSFWENYIHVNRLFAEKVFEVARPGDIIWVQDYHLMLLPGMLREQLPTNEIGFFLHIPFPSYELFRLLPWRKQILEGLLGADVIGFHTYEYMRHFMSSIYRITKLENRLGAIYYQNRVVQVDTFPMGINYEKFEEAANSENVEHQIELFKNRFGELKFILSVDRLDYSKGIPHRLRAFEKFLSRNPKYRGKVSLIMVTVPSRDTVEQYAHLKEEIDEAVGKINGKYATLGWTPIHYYYRSIPFEQLVALYKLADIALVTPLRDGMNLVAKEYVATKTDQKGTLVLSEFAGAAIELVGSLVINPNDVLDISRALESAMEMPEVEQQNRMENMQDKLRKQTVNKWAADFIGVLDNITQAQHKLQAKAMTQEMIDAMAASYHNASKRLLLLDYDGTLVPFANNPQDAMPDQELLDILARLVKSEQNEVVIISGRDHFTLEKWFKDVGVEMIAEHGTWFKKDGDWEEVLKIKDSWKKELQPLMQEFVDKTPGSFIEEKPHSLAWHYRKTDSWLGDIRAQELRNSLIYPCTTMNLNLIDGNKVIEVRPIGVDKGTATKEWLKKQPWDFVLAIGDDQTDEDIFRALPENANSVKVGFVQTEAKYNVRSWKEVRNLLQDLSAELPVLKQAANGG